MAKKGIKHKKAWWIHRERALRAKRERIRRWNRGDDLFVTRTRRDGDPTVGPVTTRYECPICGANHSRDDHERKGA